MVRFAVKNVTIHNITYEEHVVTPLNVNNDNDCLMLAKFGLTHVNLAIIIDDEAKDVRLSLTYGDNGQQEILFDSNKSSNALVYEIAKIATENPSLRPDDILKDMDQYLCNGNLRDSILFEFLVKTYSVQGGMKRKMQRKVPPRRTSSKFSDLFHLNVFW